MYLFLLYAIRYALIIMTEKLLTLKEAAEYLGLSEEEVRQLVKKGEIPAYQIGGMYLRFKEEQIFSLKPRYSKKIFAVGARKKKENSPDKESKESKESFITNIGDFFYFSNFYIISVVIITVLAYIIYKSIK